MPPSQPETPLNQKVVEAENAAAYARLAEVAGQNPLDGVAAAIGMIFGAAHFLKALGARDIARQTFQQAAQYAQGDKRP